MQEKIDRFLTTTLGAPTTILSVTPLSGGDINAVFKVTTNHGTYCIKQNNRHQFPRMFEKEAAGLQELATQSNFSIPQVIGNFEAENHQYLVLEFIQSAPKSNNFWEVFGTNLASMHRVTSDVFGAHPDNYIGSLPQSNAPRSSWAKFYAEERILPQVKWAQESGIIDSKLSKSAEELCTRFDQLFPKEPPALLHGDLWSGNYMTDENGAPTLIDPAVYYGHREMDLGMMYLFGGFSEQLFEMYQEQYPLESAWKDRIPLTQLYPLLVHVNLFGGSYIQSVQSVIQRFV